MQCEGVAWLRGLEVLQWPVSSLNLGLRTGDGGAGVLERMMVWQVSQISEKQKRCQALRFGWEQYVECGGEVGTTDAEHVGGVGTTDAK